MFSQVNVTTTGKDVAGSVSERFTTLPHSPSHTHIHTLWTPCRAPGCGHIPTLMAKASAALRGSVFYTAVGDGCDT